jgi:hypothetical protein
MSGEMRLSLDTSECLGTQRRSIGALLADLKAHLVASIKISADYHKAAAMYEQHSKLAEAELRRRGLSHATLARDVCAACSPER